MTYRTTRRVLARNESSRIPARHMFVDCETDQIPSPTNPAITYRRLKLWCASVVVRKNGQILSRAEFSGKTSDEFWAQVYRRCVTHKPIWLWAHNAAQDMTWLDVWNELDRGNMEYRRGIIEERPFILYLNHFGTNIRIVDSLNWFNMKLVELGPMVGLDKLEKPTDANDMMAWLTYCRRDVDILEKVILNLLDFVKENDLGMFRATLPQQALAAYCHRKDMPKIEMPMDLDVKGFEREAYFSGRNECGYVGKVVSMEQPLESYLHSDSRSGNVIYGEAIYNLDFKSFYPSVMSNNRYPVKYVARMDRVTLGQLESLIKTDCVVSKVLINTKSTPYPYRDKKYTTYPVGRFWTVLCTPEIQMGLERGEIERVGVTQLYKSGDIFTSHIAHMWKLRKKYAEQGNKIYDEITKLLMNSLFGKFGQRAGGWRDYPKLKPPCQWGTFFAYDSDDGKWYFHRAIAGITQRKFDDGETLRSFPAISAHVSSYGRVKLQKTLEMMPQQSVYYWDTDSLHCNHVGYQFLCSAGMVREGELGYLSIKGQYDLAEYINGKVYLVDGQYVISGTPSDAETVGDWTMLAEYWARVNELVTQKPDGSTYSRKVQSEISTMFERRAVRADGWTFPLYQSYLDEEPLVSIT